MALQTVRSTVNGDIVPSAIAQWIVVDMDMDRRNIGFRTDLSDTTCSLAKVIECETVWWHNTIGICIIIVLDGFKLSAQHQENYNAHTIFRAHKLISSYPRGT